MKDEYGRDPFEPAWSWALKTITRTPGYRAYFLGVVVMAAAYVVGVILVHRG